MTDPRTCPDCNGWTSDETGIMPCERCDDTGVIDEPDYYDDLPEEDE